MMLLLNMIFVLGQQLLGDIILFLLPLENCHCLVQVELVRFFMRMNISTVCISEKENIEKHMYDCWMSIQDVIVLASKALL